VLGALTAFFWKFAGRHTSHSSSYSAFPWASSLRSCSTMHSCACLA
jgi:hypothetical protein